MWLRLSLSRAVALILYTIESPEKLFKNPHSQVTTWADYYQNFCGVKPRYQYVNFLSGSSVLPRLRITAKTNGWFSLGGAPTLGQPVRFVKHADCWAVPQMY